MKFASIIAVSLILSVQTGALAEDAKPVVDTAATKPQNDRVICKVQEETGSLIAKQKVCLTAAQWRERSFNAGQWTERQSTNNSQLNGGK